MGRDDWKDLWGKLTQPTLEWGPALPEVRRKFSYPALPEDNDDEVFDTEMKEVMTFTLILIIQHYQSHN